MSELTHVSASELAQAIQDRQLSCLQALDAYLDRIEHLNPAINAVIALNADAARERAKAADAALEAGEHWGPLHGVPMTIKDAFEVTGMATVCGAPALKDHRSKTNAVAVQRLIDAGAIVFGKTNVPLFAQDIQSYNAVFGTSKNPWNSDRTPGGSSGGAAAAVAAGFTAFELGSDIGGSIRTPAHFCGVYGHKSSHGIIPMRGHIPGPPGTLSEPDLAVAGPLARDPRDLSLAMDILAGPHGPEAKGWQLELPPARHKELRNFRVACWLDDPLCPVDKATRAALADTVEKLRAAGVQVQESPELPFSLKEGFELYERLLNAIIGAGLPAKVANGLRRIAPVLNLFGRNTSGKLGRFASAATQRFRDWARSNEMRERQRADWERFFEDYDVLLMPVTPTSAIKHDHSGNLFSRKIEVDGEKRPYFDQFMWIGPPTAALLPVTCAPIGQNPGGMPIGMQIVGGYLEDHTTIEFARLLSSIARGYRVPPGFE